jgi:hypothetical protein
MNDIGLGGVGIPDGDEYSVRARGGELKYEERLRDRLRESVVDVAKVDRVAVRGMDCSSSGSVEGRLKSDIEGP